MSDFLAGSDASDAFVPTQLFAGSLPVHTEPGTLITGQNLAQWTVVSRIAASGKLTQWAPAGSGGAQIAVGILCHAIDATAADKGCEIYISGTFNRSLVVWPGGATAAQKALAFDNTKISTRDLGYSL
jgi:hypothetical protein